MPNINSNRKIFLAVLFLLAVVFLVYALALIFTPAGIAENLKLIKINNTNKFNDFVFSRLNVIVFTAFLLALFVFLINKYNLNSSLLKAKLLPIFDKILTFITLKKFVFVVFLYLVVVFYISIKNFDLGIDEAWYLEYSKNFYNSFISYCTNNGKPFLVDNISMLPMMLLSALNFFFGLTDVWHFKLLSSLIALASLGSGCWVLYKLYNINISILFLILIVIQTGFSFVASSFFGEIAQCSFFFFGIYIWFKSEKITLKDIIKVSILFALTIQTKSQLIFVFTASLIIFQFLAEHRKPLSILFLTMSITIVFIILRTLPVLLSNDVSLDNVLKLYMGSFETNFLFLVSRLHLFDRFNSVFLLFISLIFIMKYLRTELERFLFLFTVIAFLWWIFLFNYSTYRHLFMALIPFCFLLAITLFRFLNSEQHIISWNLLFFRGSVRFLIAICIFYGFSINILQSYIGYNDGVQFDLDGNKTISFENISHDDSQKQFFRDIKNYITPQDTLYLGSFVTRFYLPNLTLDKYLLEQNLKAVSTPKYVLIGRDIYPLSLEEGYKLLDNMNAKKELLLKNGSFELYKVHAGN